MYVATRKGKLFEDKYSPEYIEVKDAKCTVSFNKEDVTNGYLKSYIIEVKDKTDLKDLKIVGWVTYVSEYTSIIGLECIESMVKYIERLPNVISIQEASTGRLWSNIPENDENIAKYANL